MKLPKKLYVGSWFILSALSLGLAAPTPALARGSSFESCGILEEQVRSVIERKVQKSFHALPYQLRNTALMQQIVEAGKQDPNVAAALKAMRGHPGFDNDTRLKYSDLLTQFMHDRKLDMSPALVACPEGYSVDESKLSMRLWKPDAPSDSNHSAQGLSEESDMPHACQPSVDPHYAPDSSVDALESTSVSTNMDSQEWLNARTRDPELIAITTVDRPIEITFLGKPLVIKSIDVMTYLHLKNGAIEEVNENIFLHGKMATFGGREVELESLIDNEILPPVCKDFHSMPALADGGSTTGGIIQSTDAPRAKETKLSVVPAQ